MATALLRCENLRFLILDGNNLSPPSGHGALKQHPHYNVFKGELDFPDVALQIDTYPPMAAARTGEKFMLLLGALFTVWDIVSDLFVAEKQIADHDAVVADPGHEFHARCTGEDLSACPCAARRFAGRRGAVRGGTAARSLATATTRPSQPNASIRPSPADTVRSGATSPSRCGSCRTRTPRGCSARASAAS